MSFAHRLSKFLHQLWSTPVKASLIAWLGAATGIFVVRLTGPSGELKLPATTATELLLLTGALLFSVGAVAYSYHQKLEALKREHEEEHQVRDGILFKRGKRTGGKWMAFCPVCERPADTTILAKCPDTKCMWQAMKAQKDIDEVILQLPP